MQNNTSVTPQHAGASFSTGVTHRGAIGTNTNRQTPGYSGVGIYTRQSVCAPIRAEEGLLGVLCPPDSSTPYRELPDDQCIGGYPTPTQIADLGVDPAVLDAEGRCVVLEFPAFVLFGVYSPANSNGMRDDFRYGFVTALDTRIRNLEKMGKRVILTGDLNVSREEIDTAKAEESMRKEGITREEYFSAPNRRLFNQLLEGGRVYGERDEGREKPVLWDICRGFHEGRKGMYTHWEQKINARPGNYGSRIDYVLCSIEMKSWVLDSNIQEGLMVGKLELHSCSFWANTDSQGSDHCPAYAAFKQKVDLRGEEVNILDIMNPSGMFKNGKRLREYSTKDLPAFSGKLLPEFDKRRSIKDMFTRKPSPAISKSNVELPALPSTVVDSAGDTPGADTASTSNTDAASTSQNLAPPSTARSTSSSTGSPEKKRHSNDSQPSRPAKRTKASSSSFNTTATLKGQQSLKGFFKPKASTSTSSNIASLGVLEESTSNGSPLEPTSNEQVSETAGLTTASPAPNIPKSSRNTRRETSDTPTTPKAKPPSSSFCSPSTRSEGTDADFIDPIISKESWTKLFTKKPAPRCEGHDEPCITFTTKKNGVNCGRQFWVCSR